jgi:ABC-type multidrug transport system fused ATPase/permease subunit
MIFNKIRELKEQGKVIGTGKHKALLKSTPLYKELAATQMLD